jgi:hypothetical protein
MCYREIIGETAKILEEPAKIVVKLPEKCGRSDVLCRPAEEEPGTSAVVFDERQVIR